MKSASNGGVFKGYLQVLHVHVLLVAPLGTGHMAQPSTDQHESRIAVRKTTHHASAAADLPVQSFNDIVGADTGPMLAGKIAVMAVSKEIPLSLGTLRVTSPEVVVRLRL